MISSSSAFLKLKNKTKKKFSKCMELKGTMSFDESWLKEEYFICGIEM